MLPRGNILAAWVILSGAISVWSERLTFSAKEVEVSQALGIVYIVTYAILLLATIGLAISTIQSWIEGGPNNLEGPFVIPHIWAVLAFLFGLVILVEIRPELWAEVSVVLPDSNALPPTRH